MLEIQTSFKNRLATYKILLDKVEDVDIGAFLRRIKPKVCGLISNIVVEKGNLKLNLELFAKYVKFAHDNEDLKSFNTKFEVISPTTDLENVYDKMVSTIDKKSSEFQACRLYLSYDINSNYFILGAR